MYACKVGGFWEVYYHISSETYDHILPYSLQISVTLCNLELLPFPKYDFYSYACFAAYIRNSAIAHLQCKRHFDNGHSLARTPRPKILLTIVPSLHTQIINSTGNAWHTQLAKGCRKMLHIHESTCGMVVGWDLWILSFMANIEVFRWRQDLHAVRTTTYVVNVSTDSCTPSFTQSV